MRLAISSNYSDEYQDLATATIAVIPESSKTRELKNWCNAHNANPDAIVLSPGTGGDYYFTYGGDALLIASYNPDIECYQTNYGDREVEVAIVYTYQLKQVAAALGLAGIKVETLLMAID